jgi:hypothetical protein
MTKGIKCNQSYLLNEKFIFSSERIYKKSKGPTKNAVCPNRRTSLLYVWLPFNKFRLTIKEQVTRIEKTIKREERRMLLVRGLFLFRRKNNAIKMDWNIVIILTI